jgi:uncharacterized repeat protein (TIGR03803 family)
LIRNTDKWTEKVLDSCSASGCPDGWFPLAGLISSTGNLYGPTFYGGNDETQCAPTGCGTVFVLVAHHAKSTEKVLHTFCSTSRAPLRGPRGGVIFDASGNLYGTTQYGGLYGFGTVFELIPGSGAWTEKVIHNFNNDGQERF